MLIITFKLLLLIILQILNRCRSEISLQIRNHNDPHSYFALCLAVKDEVLDLREWIEYHYRLGK